MGLLDDRSAACPHIDHGAFTLCEVERERRAAATVTDEERHDHNMHLLGLIRDDHGWTLSRVLLAERLEEAVRHVIADSPGTPETVKGYLRTALRGF